MELLKAVNEELAKLLKKNKELEKENINLKEEKRLFNSFLEGISTEILCNELKRRYFKSFIEVSRDEKIFITTSKGIKEFKDRDIILVIRY